MGRLEFFESLEFELEEEEEDDDDDDDEEEELEDEEEEEFRRFFVGCRAVNVEGCWVLVEVGGFLFLGWDILGIGLESMLLWLLVEDVVFVIILEERD